MLPQAHCETFARHLREFASTCEYLLASDSQVIADDSQISLCPAMTHVVVAREAEINLRDLQVGHPLPPPNADFISIFIFCEGNLLRYKVHVIRVRKDGSRYQGGSLNANIKIASRGELNVRVGDGVHVFVCNSSRNLLEVEIFDDHVGDDVAEAPVFNYFSSRLCYLNSFCAVSNDSLLAITYSSILIIFGVHTAQNGANR